jgi:Ca2+-binding EF-hand superfamily protein
MISGVSQYSNYASSIDLTTILKNQREEMFAKMDTDGNGSIDKVELQSFSQQFADKVKGPSADEILSQMDTDGDGQISKAEFNTAEAKRESQMASMKSGPPPPNEDIFSSLDTNGDGYVDKTELEAFAQQFSDEVKGPSAEDILAKLDTDGDGQISKAEFNAAEAERESRAASMRPEATSTEEMFSSMDTNGDGQISKAEFDAVQAKMESQMIAAMVEQTRYGDGSSSNVIAALSDSQESSTGGNASMISSALGKYAYAYQPAAQSVLDLLG